MLHPNPHDMHKAIAEKGIPLDCVHWNREKQRIEIRYLKGATDAHKAAAQAIADTWDQQAVDEAKSKSFELLPKVEDIHAAKSVNDLKAMALQLRVYIDNARADA